MLKYSARTKHLLPFFLILLSVLLSSCTPRIATQSSGAAFQAPLDFPFAYYQQAEKSGANVLHIDTRRSQVVIEVRRGGVLARLGHDHVVASHDVTGYVDVTAGRADLIVPLTRLSVDETALRTEAGFTTQPSPEAIEGTRHNMLEKVLEAGRFPFALIAVRRSTTDPLMLSVTITLHDTVRTFEVPAQIAYKAGDLEINGRLSFKQSDFGITPFSILGGAMQVQDKLDLRFKIIAAEH